MTPEEALTKRPDILYGWVSMYFYQNSAIYGEGSRNKSWEFDRTLGIWSSWYGYNHDLNMAIGTDWGTLRGSKTPKELCEYALSLGYMEEAMRCSAALRQLGLWT